MQLSNVTLDPFCITEEKVIKIAPVPCSLPYYSSRVRWRPLIHAASQNCIPYMWKMSRWRRNIKATYQLYRLWVFVSIVGKLVSVAELVKIRARGEVRYCARGSSSHAHHRMGNSVHPMLNVIEPDEQGFYVGHTGVCSPDNQLREVRCIAIELSNCTVQLFSVRVTQQISEADVVTVFLGLLGYQSAWFGGRDLSFTCAFLREHTFIMN